MKGLSFDAETHTYRWKGEIVPSVTEVIRSVLRPRQHGDSVAMERGTLVHEWIAEHFADDEEPPEGIAEYVHNFRTFRDTLGLVLPEGQKTIEVRVYSEHLRVAGTIDAIARAKHLADTVLLIDWKTGPIQSWHHLQIRAYAFMASPMAFGTEWAHLQPVLVSLGAANPRPVVIERGSKGAFAAAARLYHWKRAHGMEEDDGSS